MIRSEESTKLVIKTFILNDKKPGLDSYNFHFSTDGEAASRVDQSHVDAARQSPFILQHKRQNLSPVCQESAEQQ